MGKLVEESSLLNFSGIDLHIAQQRRFASFRMSDSDEFPDGTFTQKERKDNLVHTMNNNNVQEDDDDVDDDNEDKYDKIDKISEFNFCLLSLFAIILMITHIWWFLDIIFWYSDFYSTGLNGNYFGNPMKQCPLVRRNLFESL